MADSARSCRYLGYLFEQPETDRALTAPDRKVVQISTMVHAEKDCAFIALMRNAAIMLVYHG